MIDGVYQVTTSYFCAGFIMFEDNVVSCAPILRKKFNYYKTLAVRIGEFNV